MLFRDWPAAEKPREKLLELGPGALTEAELIALLLRHGHRGASALDLARSLLARFGSLRGLLSAPREDVCRHPGIGTARWAELQAALELVRRHHLERLRFGPALTSPRAARDFLIARLRDRDHEVFCCLFLDTRHRLLGFDELFRGTLDGASVHPREVVKTALARNAAAVILAHNHPSGVAEPSQADEIITTRLRDALALVDIRLLDHLIVGDGTCASLAERGLV
ncbi:MAG: DNA repair protein RadC [Steroidobacteraceae bacterium]|jgi:DNA repair protein RadC|nr:DNA repair protein RadC [Steroidobacteraceae bacterium]